MDSLSAIILAVSLIIIMLGMGLALVVDDFKRIFQYPKAIITGLINQIVLLPLVGFGLAHFFNVRPEIAVGIIILAACPGGPTSNLITHLAKGDTALSVSLTAVSSIVTIITIPFIVNLGLIVFQGNGQVVQLNVPATIAQIFIVVLIPVGIGMLIRSKKVKFADKMLKPVRTASAIVLLMVIVGIMVKEKENIIPYFQQAGWIALSLNVITMLLGFLTARIIKVKGKQALSIAIESGIQNGTMAITIATVLLNSSKLAIAPAIYSLIMFGTGFVVIYLGLKFVK